ncbi:MAG: hypothetical protein H7311_01805 [Ramlibacter sp.]|nr:hypothetical protein [Cryobacterium sp.]
MVKVVLACLVALAGLILLPAGLWPLLAVPLWLIWEIPDRMNRLRFSRDVQRDWALLVDS